MDFAFWFLINLLKSQSIHVFLLIIFNGIIIFLEFLNLSQQNSSSYEIKSFLPERHLNKNFTPHVGGIFLISSLLIVFFGLKINHIVKLIILSKTVLKTPLESSLWNLHSESINSNIFCINHYLINIGLIFFLKITAIGLYSKMTNNNNLLKYTGIWALVNIFLVEGILSHSTNFLLNMLEKSIFLASYNNLIFSWLGFITIIICLIMAYGINKIFNRGDSNNLINKYNLKIIILIALLSWLILNGLILITPWIYTTDHSPLFLLKQSKSMMNMASESILIFLFPMIYGLVDDISKIDEKVLVLSDKIKFLIFSVVGCLSINQEDNSSLFLGIIKMFSPKNTIISMIILALSKSFLFNSIINATNFTDGADGLLYGSLMPFLLASIFIIVFYNFNGFPYSRLSFYSLNSMHLFIFILTFIIFFSIFFNFNKKKAKIFLGETGSFGIAAILFFYIMITGLDFLFFCGFIMGFFQLFSTTLQRFWFKLNRKRLFLMAPFHHHLELLGYSDGFILTLFLLINSIGMGLGCLLYLKHTPVQILVYVEGIKNLLLS